MNAEQPETGRCQDATVILLGNKPPARHVRCESPAGHEGMHGAYVEQPNAPMPAAVAWANPAPPAGVWMVAEAVPFEGITTAIPYATEMDALRAINSGVGYSDSLRAYFVPYGQDLREVLR